MVREVGAEPVDELADEAGGVGEVGGRNWRTCGASSLRAVVPGVVAAVSARLGVVPEDLGPIPDRRAGVPDRLAAVPERRAGVPD